MIIRRCGVWGGDPDVSGVVEGEDVAVVNRPINPHELGLHSVACELAGSCVDLERMKNFWLSEMVDVVRLAPAHPFFYRPEPCRYDR